MGAVQLIADQLALGAHSNPGGYALVVGAVDWQRTGLARPVPADLLPSLASAHLTPRQRSDFADPNKYKDALGWATREINPTVSLLEPGNDVYTVYDYALDLLADTDEPVPAETWQLAMDAADPVELVAIGYQAEVTYGLHELAERAWRLAAETGHRDAVYNLGVLYELRGDLTEAGAWYRRAAGTGDTDAMTNLGILFAQNRNLDDAATWYRQAVNNGNADAMHNLGVVFEQQGKPDKALALYRLAAGIGHTDAMYNLGLLIDRRLDLEKARLRGAIEEGRATGLDDLQFQSKRDRDPYEAEGWYRRAAREGHTSAMYNLGCLLSHDKDLREAKYWFQHAADKGHTDAMYNLGNLLMLEQERDHGPKLVNRQRHALTVHEGDHDEADAWYRRAADKGDADAMYNLTILLEQRGNLDEVEVWFRRLRQAADDGDAAAMTNLGIMAEHRGDLAEAQTWYGQAVEARDSAAMYEVGNLLQSRGEFDEAQDWYRRATESARS